MRKYKEVEIERLGFYVTLDGQYMTYIAICTVDCYWIWYKLVFAYMGLYVGKE